MCVFSSLRGQTTECQQPVLQSKSARVSGWRRPPSVAESGEGIHLDGVLEGRTQPAVGQTHSHLQVHLQQEEKDSVDSCKPCLPQESVWITLGRFLRPTHLVWVA